MGRSSPNTTAAQAGRWTACRFWVFRAGGILQARHAPVASSIPSLKHLKILRLRSCFLQDMALGSAMPSRIERIHRNYAIAFESASFEPQISAGSDLSLPQVCTGIQKCTTGTVRHQPLQDTPQKHRPWARCSWCLGPKWKDHETVKHVAVITCNQHTHDRLT